MCIQKYDFLTFRSKVRLQSFSLISVPIYFVEISHTLNKTKSPHQSDDNLMLPTLEILDPPKTFLNFASYDLLSPCG